MVPMFPEVLWPESHEKHSGKILLIPLRTNTASPNVEWPLDFSLSDFRFSHMVASHVEFIEEVKVTASFIS